MDLSILYDRDGFRQQVIETLAQEQVGYLEELRFIDKQKGAQRPWAGAGVLLPLFFSEELGSEVKSLGEYVFFLSKRSQRVQQAGDLCAPGGGIHPFLDPLFERILRFGLYPWVHGPGLEKAKLRGKETYRKIVFLLGNSLRESWEELRLSPFNIEFLGPLPTYSLESRCWTIFPLVARVRRTWKPKLSWEVEKIVSIPLQAFFQADNYAVYSLEVPQELTALGVPNPWEFPCLAHNDNGEQEILWGATFSIIQAFFRIVFGFSLPSPDSGRVIRKALPLNYFSGGRNK
ncbi:MAG: coA pyrophosphatase [Deltaproteobacteria bacterium]|nr:coA pyrophosphatase [Deltaproteobacteria bacterium]